MTDCKPHVLHIFLPATKTIFTVTRGFKVIKIIVTNWASEVGNVGSGPLTERVLAFPPVENHKNGHINIFSTDFLKFFKAGFYYLNILLIKLLKKKTPKLTDLVLRLKLKLFFLIYKQTNHAHLHPQRPFFLQSLFSSSSESFQVILEAVPSRHVWGIVFTRIGPMGRRKPENMTPPARPLPPAAAVSEA